MCFSAVWRQTYTAMLSADYVLIMLFNLYLYMYVMCQNIMKLNDLLYFLLIKKNIKIYLLNNRSSIYKGKFNNFLTYITYFTKYGFIKYFIIFFMLFYFPLCAEILVIIIIFYFLTNIITTVIEISL